MKINLEESTMAELIVVGFEGKHRAAEVLEQLQRLDTNALDLKDGVAAYRTKDGRLRIDSSMEPTGKEGAVWGGVLGALIGAVLAGPFAVLAAAPAAGAAVGIGGATLGAMGGGVVGFDDAATWKEKYGISDEFVKEVGGVVQPGQSAVFVLARASQPSRVAEQFRGYGGKILRTTLSPEETKKVADTLAVKSGAST